MAYTHAYKVANKVNENHHPEPTRRAYIAHLRLGRYVRARSRHDTHIIVGGIAVDRPSMVHFEHFKPTMKISGTPNYSFYLNIIILGSAPSSDNKSSDASAAEQAPPTSTELVVKDSSPEKPKNNLLSPNFKKNNLFDKMGEKAAAFMAEKTMLSRATAALTEIVPKLVTEFKTSIKVQQRFSSGPVFVLEVSVLPSSIVSLVETAQGEEAAEKYKNVMEGLEFLNCTESIKEVEREIVPKLIDQVKHDLIKMVPEMMNEESKGGKFEMNCIALEDQEEARWLYTFLEFNAQMMKDAKI